MIADILRSLIAFIGAPIIALVIGILLTIYSLIKDHDQVMKVNKLYIKNCLVTLDDAIGMQCLIPGWKFDPKFPCMVR